MACFAIIARLLENRRTMRAPDWWESPRFQAVCVAGSWFRQSGVASSRPPAGNADRWAPEGNTVSSLEGHVELLQ